MNNQTTCMNCYAELTVGAMCMTPRCVAARPVSRPAPLTVTAVKEWPVLGAQNVPFAEALKHMMSHPAVRYALTDAGEAAPVGLGCKYFRWDRERDRLIAHEGGRENGDVGSCWVSKWRRGGLCTRLA